MAFNVMQFWSKALILFSGLFLIVDRKEELPPSPYIICPNHSSYLDIITMYQLFSEYFIFMGKAEINTWPLFNIFFTKGMNISVDRNRRMGAHIAYERAKEEVDRGHNIVIFPEGTIPTTAPYMRPFKNGAFKLSIEKNIPIVPVTFLTNWRRLQAGPALKQLGGPGISKIVVHPAVYPEQYRESGPNQMKQDIFAIIEKPILERYGDQRSTD